MKYDDLSHWMARAGAWAEDYLTRLRERPVRPRLAPGEFAARLPETAPEHPEPMDAIFDDFARLVPDAMTHWQHPRFFAYFPANASAASMVAEQLANTMAANAMLWQTAPAATEMEQVMIRWLARALALPEDFSGTIHDTATTATLSAVLTMREKALDFAGISDGLAGGPQLRFYVSREAHSSIDKAMRIAGIGENNLHRLPTRPDLSLDPEALAAAIRLDRAEGHLPAGLVLTAGGTSVGAFDDLPPLLDIAEAEGLPTHLDAAWAGSAMICPEFRPLWEGVERVDSLVFNPHKWLGAQFDCAAQFLRRPEEQIRTLSLKPAYLQTAGAEGVTDFNDWTVPLGRRFRALKLWFVLRAYGLEGLRRMIRNHVAWAEELAGCIEAMGGLAIVTPPSLSLFTFRVTDGASEAENDRRTRALLERINEDGRIFLTPTEHGGRAVIRVVVGQFETTREDVMLVAEVVRECLEGLGDA